MSGMADTQPKPAKIEQLDNDYTRRLNRQHAATHRTGWLRHRRIRRALRIGAVFAVFAIILGIQLVRTNASLHTVNQQVATSERQLKQTKADSQDLKLQIKQLNNKDYLGQLIRSKYYYSKSDETIYSLPGDHANDVTAK
ncbi:septum formation initiator [Levilactobacillus koreensis JCM 16448]|nr:septum formation initiator [Levilactobacillus koreensis JCM 16448]